MGFTIERIFFLIRERDAEVEVWKEESHALLVIFVSHILAWLHWSRVTTGLYISLKRAHLVEPRRSCLQLRLIPILFIASFSFSMHSIYPFGVM